MGKKIFLVDVAKCNGCHNCQIACKDEHCEADWLPYAAAQPDTGQFWCKVEETVHGSVPKVNITYLPKIGAQDEALREYAPEALLDRGDGLIVLDPTKCAGRKDIAEKFEGVFWNEEAGICQGCTGCAHLLDDGWTVPRCVDVCAMGALRFGEEADFASELAQAERLTPTANVYYLNLPKRWVAGKVSDPEAAEVIIGAKVTLQGEDGETLAATTDEFGDFWFKQVKPQAYNLWFEHPDFVTRTLVADATDADAHLGTVSLYKMGKLG